MRLCEADRLEFERCVGDLLLQPDVQAMDDIHQHIRSVSCLDHCIFVSYLSFRLCRRFGLDYRAAARAGLLHDLYLCDWRSGEIGRFRRLVIHPGMALKNASIHGLSELERDIILKHMWPVTLHPPRHRESFVVNLADKLCAMTEWIHAYKLFTGEALRVFNKCGPAAV